MQHLPSMGLDDPCSLFRLFSVVLSVSFFSQKQAEGKGMERWKMTEKITASLSPSKAEKNKVLEAL